MGQIMLLQAPSMELGSGKDIQPAWPMSHLFCTGHSGVGGAGLLSSVQAQST